MPCRECGTRPAGGVEPRPYGQLGGWYGGTAGGQGRPPLRMTRECVTAGRRGRRPLRTLTSNAVGRATARVAPTQKFVLGRHTQKFLLTPRGKSDTLNAIQAMMGVAARSCGRKCPPDGTVMAVECGVFRIQVEPRTMILVRPELRRQFRAFFY